MAEHLESVAATVRRYLTTDWAPWPSSPASRESQREGDFPGLSLERPVLYTLLFPRQCLGSSQDHLVAIAAALRAPHTVMAVLTLLRTQLVGCSYAAYIADQSIDGRERVRRGMNCYLDSTTEQMRLLGRVDPQLTEEFDRLATRRRRIVRGAKQLGWTIAAPEARKSNWWPKDWWIGAKPPGEMALVAEMLEAVATKDRAGRMLYQYLCATTHVQLHGLLSFIRPEQMTRSGDGQSWARTGMDGQLLVQMALAALCGLTVAMDRCVGLYAWSPDRWRSDVMPFVNDVRVAAGVSQSPAGIHLLG